MAVKIIKCQWCEGEARITYEENRIYQMKCYSCHNTMLHVDHSFDSAVEFFEHQANLLQAEQDGRLVVLPCKVGDTVYQIDAERVYESEVKWIIFDCDDIAFDERAIGGSIFLTREEAEAALKGGEG